MGLYFCLHKHTKKKVKLNYRLAKNVFIWFLSGYLNTDFNKQEGKNDFLGNFSKKKF